MQKHLTIVFYDTNVAAAKATAVKIRAAGKAGQLRNAFIYRGEVEPCDAVRVLSDVSAFDRARIEAAYGDRVERLEKPTLSLPPPPQSKKK